MKRTLHETTTKDGDKEITFFPTAHMILFANEKAKNLTRGDPDIAREAGIDPSLPGGWARKYGSYYLTWLEEFIEASAFSKQAEVLEAVGMIHATQGSYSFWKDMARKHGVIADEIKQQNITINTDFSQILLGNSAEAARDIILAEVMGIKKGAPIEANAVVVTPDEKIARPTRPIQQEAAGQQVRPDRKGVGRSVHGISSNSVSRKRKTPQTI